MATELLRVMHLTSGSDAGGVSHYLLDLNRELAARGVAVTVAGQRGSWHARFGGEPVTWIDAPLKGGPLALRSAAGALARQIAHAPPHLIHVHYRKAALVGRMLQRRLASIGSRPPILFTLHLTGVPMSFPWRLLSDFGDHAHAPSVQAQDWLTTVAHVPQDRVTLIPHGVQTARFPARTAQDHRLAREHLGLDPQGLVAAYVGRLEAPKNEDWIVDLAQQVPASGGRPVVFLFAGDGPNRPVLQRRIAQLGLLDRVRLLGECNPLQVYYAADALLLPSAREGFSYVCAEAMSCGTPVLRTRTAGTQEMIIEGVTGRSCLIKRDAFIQAAIAFLSDRAELRAMGSNAAEHVRQHLRFDQQVQRTIELYQQLVAGAASPHR
jgi:glycosyltransferase involved in cell wall biosynthesis